MPFIFWSAALFYAAIAATISIPGLKRRFLTIYEAPIPSTGLKIGPLDSCRGLAAMWILALHTWYFMTPLNDGILSLKFVRRGQMAVPIFAVLSGLLVYKSLRRKFDSATDLKHYLKRRFLRIYPLYLSTLIASSAIGLLIGKGFWGERAIHMATDVLMLRAVGYPKYVGLPAWNMPAWTLFIEVTFYLTLPVFVFFTEKFLFSRKTSSAGASLPAAVVCFVVLSAFGTYSVNHGIMLFRFFFTGIILCEIMEKEFFIKMRSLAAFAFFSVGTVLLALNCSKVMILDELLNIVLSRAGITRVSFTDTDFSLTLSFSTAFLFIGAIACKPINRVLSIYPLRFLGIVSYSVYMWQAILFRAPFLGSVNLKTAGPQGDVLTFILIFAPAVLLIASVSYALIERPFHKLRLADSPKQSA